MQVRYFRRPRHDGTWNQSVATARERSGGTEDRSDRGFVAEGSSRLNNAVLQPVENTDSFSGGSTVPKAVLGLGCSSFILR